MKPYCVIKIENKPKTNCNKCKTPNIRSGKYYCPKYKLYLNRVHDAPYTSHYENI